MTDNDRIIARIDAVAPRLEGDDASVLGYIRDAITPEALEKRWEHDRDVRHLREVAKQRLHRYENSNKIQEVPAA